MEKNVFIRGLEKKLKNNKEIDPIRIIGNYTQTDRRPILKEGNFSNIKSPVYTNNRTSLAGLTVDICMFDLIDFNGVELKELKLINCKGSVSLQNANIKRLYIEGSYIPKIHLIRSNFTKVEFGEENVIDNLLISNTEINNGWFGDFKKVERNKTYIQELKISSIPENCELSFWNCEIENLFMDGKCKPESFLLFENSYYNSLDISNLKNYGEIFFFNINLIKNEKAKVNFSSSILGNTSFNNFSFPTTISIINCDFSGIKVHNVKWPTEIHSSEMGDSSHEDYNKTREVYRNLKNVLYSQGDKVNGNYFYSQEMKAYRKSLKRKNDTYFDRFILWFNSLSNYGQDYILACLNTLLIGEILFILVIASTNLPVEDYFQKFWEFMLPTHRFDFIPQTGLSTFFDFIGRIIISVMIFITIRSFRKLN